MWQLEALRETVPCVSPSFWSLLAISDVLLPRLCLSLHEELSPVCLWVHVAFSSLCDHISSYKDTCHWIRAHPHLEWPHHNLITSTKTPFPNIVSFWGWGLHELREVAIQLSTVCPQSPVYSTSKTHSPHSNSPQSLNPFQHQLCLISDLNINSKGSKSHRVNHLNQVRVKFRIRSTLEQNFPSSTDPWNWETRVPSVSSLHVSGSVLNAFFLSTSSTYFHAS